MVACNTTAIETVFHKKVEACQLPTRNTLKQMFSQSQRKFKHGRDTLKHEHQGQVGKELRHRIVEKSKYKDLGRSMEECLRA